MLCPFCEKGQTAPGFVTVHLPIMTSDLVVRHVPAEICDFCGEYYLSEEITEDILKAKSEAENRKVTIEVVEFEPAA
jgi:YgiT-type zinc finger domain-containing protein